MIETDKKFYMVPVIITSMVSEAGYHLYEADSAEEALEMYHNNTTPMDIEHTGWMDQEYQDDELDTADDVVEVPASCPDVQDILRMRKELEEKKNA